VPLRCSASGFGAGRFRLCSQIVAGHVGGELDDVADTLLSMKSQQRYLLLGTIARTRSCTVFAAVDQLLARDVALEVLHDGEDASTWRLITEVQAMTRFDHPNVVRVHELGDHAGWLYAAMELCDSDLERWCAGVAWIDVVDRLLRRLRLNGLIERHPKTHRYRVTDFGLRAARY
jgi:hypothetical protein